MSSTRPQPAAYCERHHSTDALCSKAGPLILGGDVGGTKTWLGIFRAESRDAGARLSLERSAKYPSKSAGNLGALVAQFLADARHPVDYACFGLPGPVRGRSVGLVNLPWQVDADMLAAEFGFRSCFLINDLAANACGIAELDPRDFALLNAGDADASGNMAVISPGTGLGEAGIFWDGHEHLPFACEGGHCDFAPRTELEVELFRYLHALYGHVSYERVLSGSMGLPNIYRFLRDTGRGAESAAVASAMLESDPGAVIIGAALDGSCPICLQTVELFTGILGAEAGNLALKVMAVGGMFIGGGIGARIMPILRQPPLLEGFFAKGRFAEFMRRIPLRAILNDQAALLGAARHALREAVSSAPAH